MGSLARFGNALAGGMSATALGAVICALYGLILPEPASAQIAMSGRFVAEARCPALQSIRQKSNPGTVSTDPGQVYKLIGRNADPATHYYLEFPEADPDRRWVAIGCGRIETGAVTAGASRTAQPRAEASQVEVNDASAVGGTTSRRPDGRDALTQALSDRPIPGNGRDGADAGMGMPAPRPRPVSAVPAGRYILAASWHPAFCEQRPDSRDCRSPLSVEDAEGFALHGLWPQPRDNEYCGVSPSLIAADRSGPWRRLPAPKLDVATRRDLERVMPGSRSALERHEWLRHGTCYGTDADRYFSDAVRLIDALNRSPVARLFARSIRSQLTGRTIRSAFDEAFGPGAGRKVEIECTDDDGRRIITELRIALARSANAATDLTRMISAGVPGSRGCPSGIVDAVGNQ